MSIQELTFHDYYTFSMVALVGLIPVFRRAYFLTEEAVNTPLQLNSREPLFDALKGFCMLAVILIHVLYFTVEATKDDNYVRWGLFLNNILRYSIPIFYMLSGMMLKPMENFSWRSLRKFWRPKIARTYIPYILVSLFILWGKPWQEVGLQMMTGRHQVPYYFVIDLLQFYICYPLFSFFIFKKWFLPLTLFISIFFGMEQNVHLNFFVQAGYFPFFFKYIFYFALGMRLHYAYNSYRPDHAFLLWLLFALIHIPVSFYAHQLFYNEQFFYGMGCFNLFILIFQRFTFLQNIFAPIGRVSLWIYLIHFHILEKLINWVVTISESLYDFTFYHYFFATLITLPLAFILDFLYKRFLRLIKLA